ncbi:MAG TPA: hypothetical protein VJ892_03385 [Candidatus Absconditabacterales bacterium]|nr:hypothetical protein [Candidatus Absconditabacterales bacterium]
MIKMADDIKLFAIFLIFIYHYIKYLSKNNLTINPTSIYNQYSK